MCVWVIVQWLCSSNLSCYCLLQVWTLRNYDDPDPVILSVSEEEEISIADIAKAVHSKSSYIYARVPTLFISLNKLMAHAFLIATKMVCNVNRSWCLTQRRQMGNSRRLLIIREYNDIFLGMHFFMHLLPPNQL